LSAMGNKVKKTWRMIFCFWYDILEDNYSQLRDCRAMVKWFCTYSVQMVLQLQYSNGFAITLVMRDSSYCPHLAYLLCKFSLVVSLFPYRILMVSTMILFLSWPLLSAHCYPRPYLYVYWGLPFAGPCLH
jgi:hypothetical protein